MFLKRAIVSVIAAATLTAVGVMPAQAATAPMPPGWSASNPAAGWAVSWVRSNGPLAYTGYVPSPTKIWGQGICDSGYNCTQYVAYRLRANGAPDFVENCSTGSNAASWDDRAARCGIPVNQTPAAGAVIQWESWPTAGYGHVAYVDAVFGDTLLVSEAGCGTTGVGGEAREVMSLSALKAKFGTQVRFIHAQDTANPGSATMADSRARAYVNALFIDLLGRAPDAQGLDFWSSRLVNGTSTYGDVANGITGSQEYRGNLIDAAYRQYLGRGVDAGGLSTWLSQMAAGAKIEDVQANLLGSQEALAQAGGTASGWVASLYQKVLGRAASPSEVSFWVGQLNGGASMVSVAGGFLYSTEHLNSVVNGYYVSLLGRSADPSGLATWVGQIQSGIRDEQVIASLVSSQEFLGRI